MCGLDRSSGFGGCRLQHPPKPPTVFGARCVSRRPMKYLKHVLKLHVQYLLKYSYTRWYSSFVGENAISQKAQSKRKANPRVPCEQRLHFRGSSYFSHASSYRENVASARRVIPERRIHQNIEGIFGWYNMSQGVQNSISVPLDRCGFGG